MPDYYEALAALHQAVRPSAYLEIGVRDGASLLLAQSGTLCIGVDPEPGLLGDLADRCTIDIATSDDFFASDRPGKLLAGRSLDLAFIDGMHLFEFALRDFANIERLAHPGTLVALHDCLPRDAASSSRDRSTDFWTGDVWRLVLCLLDNRPDLELALIDAPPSGLLLVRGLDPENRTLISKYDPLVSHYLSMGFDEWERRWPDVSQRLCDLESLIQLVAGGKAAGGPPDANARVRRTGAPAIVGDLYRRKPRLLGVLLCYNDADVLGDIIEHLLDNGHDVVAWDHGSTDETPAVLDRYSDALVERRLIPREFDFYNLYPEMSRHLIGEYCGRYDWISWPDDDEILEGPDRTVPYQEHLEHLFSEGYDWVRSQNFNFWVTAEDDSTVTSPVDRVRRYSIFPDCAPRIRSWRATVTNSREFNHNPLAGREYEPPFRLRHYPARTYAQLYRRVFLDRANLRRGAQNFHYENLLRNLARVHIPAESLLFDDGFSDLSPKPVFDWLSLYGESDQRTDNTHVPRSSREVIEPKSLDDVILGVVHLLFTQDPKSSVTYYWRQRPRFADDPRVADFDSAMSLVENL